MGLDMYLRAKLHLSDYQYQKGQESAAFQGVLAAVGMGDSLSRDCHTPSLEVSVTVAYWRKANQIHRWFVENCQGGNDDCGEYYVSREQLVGLVALCKQVLGTVETIEGEVRTGTAYYPDGRVVQETKRGEVVAQEGLAAELLPTQEGFFFGGTDYDEYYLEDLRNTVKMLEAVLGDPRLADWEFEYHSSW